MASDLSGKKVLFMVSNEVVEQVELTRPRETIVETGGEPVLAATQAGTVQAFEHLDRAESFPVDVTADSLQVVDYDGVVLPGGVASPDQLRTDERAVEFLRAFAGAGKPVAAICHGPWTLVEGGLVRGRTLTSWPSLRTDIRNAGGEWVDEELVECDRGQNVLITSRKPDDLDAFCRALVRRIAETGASNAA